MNEKPILDSVRKAMLERFPDTFKSGNVRVVAFAVASAQNGDEAYQIFPLGAAFEPVGGGDLWRRQTIGIRIWRRVVADQLSVYEQMEEEMSDRVRLVIKCLHQHYESEIGMQEPFFVESESPRRTVDSVEVGFYAYVDLTVRAQFISTAAEIEED